MRLILDVIWFVLAGLWLAISYLLAALLMFILVITIPFALQAVKLARASRHRVVLCITIMVIPLGLGSFKMIPVCLWPFGREIVPVEQADATAVTIGAGSAAQPRRTPA
ncbi:MAG: YccF domain-containing protein [Solirubrobacterales bacterium]